MGYGCRFSAGTACNTPRLYICILKSNYWPEKYCVHLQLRGLASRQIGLRQHSGWNKTLQLGTQYLSSSEDCVNELNPVFSSSWHCFMSPVHLFEGQRMASMAEHFPPHPTPWPQVTLVRLWFLWQHVTDKVLRAFDTLSSKFSTDMSKLGAVAVVVGLVVVVGISFVVVATCCFWQSWTAKADLTWNRIFVFKQPATNSCW